MSRRPGQRPADRWSRQARRDAAPPRTPGRGAQARRRRGTTSTDPMPSDRDWGPVLAAWEGWASDEEIRHRGSSGGAVTALADFALSSGAADGGRAYRGPRGRSATERGGDQPRPRRPIEGRGLALTRRRKSRRKPRGPSPGETRTSPSSASPAMLPRPTRRCRPTRRWHRRFPLPSAIFCAGRAEPGGHRPPARPAWRAEGRQPGGFCAIAGRAGRA